jgi:hypothetical protein
MNLFKNIKIAVISLAVIAIISTGFYYLGKNNSVNASLNSAISSSTVSLSTQFTSNSFLASSSIFSSS